MRFLHGMARAISPKRNRLRDSEAEEAARPPMITEFHSKPVRGIAIAVVLAIPLWVGIVWLVHRLLR